MHIKCLVLRNLDDTARNVGAVVGNTLKVVEYIRKDKAVLDRALALLKTENVVELYLVHKSEGDILCERKDGNEIVWFCRNRESIHTGIDKHK